MCHARLALIRSQFMYFVQIANIIYMIFYLKALLSRYRIVFRCPSLALFGFFIIAACLLQTKQIIYAWDLLRIICEVNISCFQFSTLINIKHCSLICMSLSPSIILFSFSPMCLHNYVSFSKLIKEINACLRVS
jgi:hypothetical protein